MLEYPPLRDGNASTRLRAPSWLSYGQSKSSAMGVCTARSPCPTDANVPHQNPWRLYVRCKSVPHSEMATQAPAYRLSSQNLCCRSIPCSESKPTDGSESTQNPWCLYVPLWECPLFRDNNASTSLRAPFQLAYGQSKPSIVGVSLLRVQVCRYR